LFNASELKIELVAYLLLIVGALGDWASTRFGVSLGLVEGNTVAASLMSSSKWWPLFPILRRDWSCL